MWFHFGSEGILEKTLRQRDFRDIRTNRFTITFEIATTEEYREAVPGISSRLQMLLKNIPPEAAGRIKTAVMAATESFRDGDVIRIPCEEVVAAARC